MTHRWVEDARALVELEASLAQGASLALDSESNSGFAYEERLCLLQINDGRDIWLIDLLALSGDSAALDPLRPYLEDPGYEIQLHGGEFDVGCLKRDYQIHLAGVWDTQQAASFLGWEKTGYGAVVERVCGVALPKAHTRSDWSRRPIEGEELRYAINDVRYLPAVAAQLQDEVRRVDLEEEVLIACQSVEEATWNGGFRREAFWSLKGVRQLGDVERGVLMALYLWRETIAQELDLPPGRAMHNELLMALARNLPGRREELKRLGVPRRVIGRWSADLLAVIVQARKDPPELPPAPIRRPYDRQVQKRGDRLKKWRRVEAERRQVPMQVVLPVAAVRHLQEHGAGDLESVPQLGRKRIALYGDKLLQLAAT
jgi:ribonuclease D